MPRLDLCAARLYRAERALLSQGQAQAAAAQAVLHLRRGEVMQKAKTIRHSTLKQRAEIIDLVVDRYKKIRRRKNFPKILVERLLEIFFPGEKFIGKGPTKMSMKYVRAPTSEY